MTGPQSLRGVIDMKHPVRLARALHNLADCLERGDDLAVVVAAAQEHIDRYKPCTVTASCEEGSHTYSWPCDYARGTGEAAAPQLPRWLVRLDEAAVTGLYLAYRDLLRRLR